MRSTQLTSSLQKFILKVLIILLSVVSNLWMDNFMAQDCLKPDVYTNFDDSETKVSINQNVSIGFSNSDLSDGFEGNGLHGILKYSIKKLELRTLAISFKFRTPEKVWKATLLGGKSKAENNVVAPVYLGFNKEQIVRSVRTVYNGEIKHTTIKTPLYGVGLLSPDQYYDREWHEVVILCDYSTGQCQYVIDGVSSKDFMLEVPDRTEGEQIEYKGSFNFGEKNHVILDNVAIYVNKSMSIEDLTYEDRILFDFCSTESTEISYQENITRVDTMEFPLGFQHYNDLTKVNDILVQLDNYPNPRYNTEHTLHRNFPWVDYHSIGGRGISGFSGNRDTIISRALLVQEELIKNWNYSCTVFPSGDLKTLEGQFNLMANEYPTVSSVLRLNWGQIRPKDVLSTYSFKPYIKNKSLRSFYYHGGGENSKTSFIRSTSNFDPIRIDGLVQMVNLKKSFSILTRPINLINENGELPALIYSNMFQGTKGVKSIKDVKSFLSDKVTQLRTLYRNEMLNHPFLVNTDFSYYSVDGIGGHTGYNKKYDWKIIRKINTPVSNYYFSTMDFYPYSPQRWDQSIGPRHGMSWVRDARQIELSAGDKLFSPFVCAGWRNDPRGNIRPAQYLGLLKSLGVLGAEFYYSAYFNHVAPDYVFQDPKNWIWQLSIPSYAQAVISRAEYILKQGQLLTNGKGGYIMNFPDNLTTSYTSIREWKNSQETEKHFLISTSLQTKTNYRVVDEGNYQNVKIKSVASFPGVSTVSAYEGRTYILQINEKESSASQIVYYCLDGWHEPYHPERWSENILIEAELYDQADELLVRKTINNKTGEAYSIENLDFTDFTTFVSSADSENYQAYNVEDSPQLKYSFQPRAKTSNPEDFAMWINMRKTSHLDRSKLGVIITEVSTGKVVFKRIIQALLTDEFHWYKLELGKEVISVKNQENYSVEILLMDNQFELDQLMFSFNETDNTKYTSVFSEYVDSELSFEVAKTCGTDLYVENMTFVSDNDFTFSYTVSKNWFRSLKSGKNLTEPLKHKKSKFYITGTRINNDIVQEGWWNEDYWKPKFELDFSKKKKAYVKLEMFKDGKRVGKEKQKIYLSELSEMGLDISKQEICKGDTMTVFKEFDTQEISNVVWSPSLYLLDENDTKATFMPYKTSYIYVQGNDKNGCEVKDSIVVKVNEVNMNYTGAKHIQICDGEKGPLELSTDVEGGKGPYELDWREVEVKQLHEKDSKYFVGNGKIPLNDELLELQITDQDGCRTKEYIFLQVLEKEKCKNE